MKHLVDSQKSFFNSHHKKIPGFELYRYKKIKKLLLENKEKLKEAIYSDFKKHCKIINGKETSFALETIVSILSTAHILGGAVMCKDATEGVINSKNKVFGYHNMYVNDGSMISVSPGVNPALSITAIAERVMDLFKNRSIVNLKYTFD